MNKLNYLIPVIFFLLFINLQPVKILAQVQQDESRTNSIDLSKKNYYEVIFTKDERKQLKKANSYLTDAQKYMLEYRSSQKEIENLYTLAKSTSSSSASAKSLEKARKLEKKSLKSGNKSIDYFKKATDIKTNIYTTSIGRTRLTDNSTHAEAGKELESKAKDNYEKGREKLRTAPVHDPQLNLKVQFDAYDLILEALSQQENAFAIYKKDPQVNPDDFYFVPENNNIVKDTVKVKPVVVADSVLFPIYTEQYNPFADKNLYHSQIDKIIPLLKLSPEENNLLAESSRKNQYANDLLKQVDDAYIIVDSLNYIADRTPDFTQRDKLRNSAIEKEQQAFYKLTNATNIHLDVNETRYKIYKAHFPKVDPKKTTPEIEQAKKLEIVSDQYYSKAKNDIAQANKLTYQSEQYVQKMGANDMLLYALQLQENAYGIYFKIKDINISKPDSLPGKNQIVNSKKDTKQDTTKSLNWELDKTYSYSKEKPKPVIYKVKNGVVFLVQLGIFKGIIPAGNFANIQPIVYDEFVNNPYRRFMVGEYKSAEAAETALNKVKKMGYDDAYIVSLINGQRKSYAAGKEIANTNDENYKSSKKLEMSKLSDKEDDDNKVDNTPKEGVVSGNNIKNTKGLVYLVQLGMFSKPITYKELNNLQPIYTDIIPGKGTRYMKGTYSSFAEAKSESQHVVDNGFPDAYVVAYLDGKHISLDKAKSTEAKQEGNTGSKTVSTNGSITFMVQIGAYREKLSTTEENKLKALYTPRNIEIKKSEDMNLYLVGNYKTYKEADYLKKKLINEGHEGVFVVAFNGEDKITVEHALKSNKNK